MTGRAIYYRGFALQVFDLFEVLIVNRSHHRGHVARNLFRRLVIFLKSVWNMTVCAGNTQ